MQILAVWLLILGAALYLLRRYWRLWRGQKREGGGCGASCGGCAGQEKRTRAFPLPDQRHRDHGENN